MQLDGMRVERLFHVEHPISAPSLYNKFKVRDKMIDFGHTAFEVVHNALNVFNTRCSCDKFTCNIAGIGILFQERSRIRFELRKDAVRIRKTTASIFLLRKFFVQASLLCF